MLALARQQRDDRGRDWHYAAQAALFDFVVSLHSAFESSFYGLYFVGAQIRPTGFAHVTDDDTRRSINPKAVTTEYAKQWPGSGLAIELAAVKDSSFYVELARTRNVLAHRIAPGFEHQVTLEGVALESATEYDYALAWRGEKVEALVPRMLSGAEGMTGLSVDAGCGILRECQDVDTSRDSVPKEEPRLPRDGARRLIG
ncbi:hypothetical protein AB0F18_13935 [Streptomyces sp. NPDC029216]|uniref:hypothetical protein n=1 Tax=Streptomyces sp. NPDC029216 TaxID=3154701 RepID=UPI0034016F20